MPFFFFDPTFFLAIPALLLAFYAQQKVQSTFQNYLQERSAAGYTGAQVARAILDAHGLQHVGVERTGGHLTDHYNPLKKVVQLSAPVYSSASVASIGVAAHEAGHAIQHARNYVPLGIRNSLFPVARFGSQIGVPLFFIGMIAAWPPLMTVGIWFFLAAFLFQLVTLPVEFNASSRALQLLDQGGFLSRSERPKTKAVLDAAALTYVASAAVAATQLLRLILLRNMRRR